MALCYGKFFFGDEKKCNGKSPKTRVSKRYDQQMTKEFPLSCVALWKIEVKDKR